MTLQVLPVTKRKRIPTATINEVVRKIVEKFHPQKIILFGSYARGNPRPESDLDMLVVMETGIQGRRKSLEIRHHLGVMFGLDLIVYSPHALEERIQKNDWFLREIVETGKIVYERPDN